jgi:hypothetical protein
VVDEASALAHLACFPGVGEVVQAMAAQAGMALLRLLTGDKTRSAAKVRGDIVRALYARGIPRPEIGAVLRVTPTCVGGALPDSLKKKRPVVLRHGLSLTSEYRAWQTMRLRCTNPKNQAYPDYGGRGIWVCARWMGSPTHLLADMGPKPSANHEIDRIDNDKGYTCGYCPDCVARGAAANCRWVTRDINDQNRRSNRLIEFRGETLSLIEWSRRLTIRADTISERLVRGWSVERALTEPVRPKASNGSAVPRAHDAEHGNTKYPREVILKARAECEQGAEIGQVAARHGIPRRYLRRVLRGEKRTSVMKEPRKAAA